MQGPAVVLGVLSLVLGLLATERLLLHAWHRRIPCRIVVLGTRGKSSIVRLIAFGLRRSGLRVLYKTTGSRPVRGNVDGTETTLARRGLPNPLEQRGLLRSASRQGANVLVVEAMSIRPESLRAEVRRILSPTIAVIARIGADHLADIDDPCTTFADAVPDGCVAVVGADAPPEIGVRFAARGVVLERAPAVPAEKMPVFKTYEEWPENVALALAACRVAGAEDESARDGMRHVIADRGALTAWRIHVGESEYVTVNAFAANDPDATRRALDHAAHRWAKRDVPIVGLLNLRSDRGDRTVQWTESLAPDRWPFTRVIVTGSAPYTVRRRLRRAYGDRVSFPTRPRPHPLMADVAATTPTGAILFGFGNIAGVATALIGEWERQGIRL